MDQALGDHSTKISSVISQAYVDRCNQEALTDKQVSCTENTSCYIILVFLFMPVLYIALQIDFMYSI